MKALTGLLLLFVCAHSGKDWNKYSNLNEHNDETNTKLSFQFIKNKEMFILTVKCFVIVSQVFVLRLSYFQFALVPVYRYYD